MNRFPPSAGIAIGPILFVLAMLGVLAAVLSANSGGNFGSAGTTDRVFNDIVGQANLIRSKIAECEMQYEVNGTSFAAAPCAGDPYPCSDQANGTLVSALTCPNDPLVGGDEQSLWIGARVASFPPPTKGFSDWMYMNAGADGGRCFWTAPTGGSGNSAGAEGLRRASQKFTSGELKYDNASASQKFVIMITQPTGAVDSHCTAP